MTTRLPDPPIPASTTEAARWKHTRQRRRLLSGLWEQDLLDVAQEQLGRVRRSAWGRLDMSAMPFRNICAQLAVLYDGGVTIGNDQPGDFSAFATRLAASGLWASAPHFQTMVIGCREGARAIDVKPDGSFLFRDVSADTVVAYADPNDPGRPLRWEEARLRQHPTSATPVWTWDCFDITDASAPYYRIKLDEGGKPGEDLTDAYLGEWGAEYRWRWADGSPFIPRVLYHARRLGDRLWDPYEGRELVEGSLNVALELSLLLHSVFDASWPARMAVNLEILSAGIEDGRVSVISDPSIVHQWAVRDPEAGQSFFHQFAPAIDVDALHQVVLDTMHRLAVDAGIPSSDIQRLAVGTARSGAAISLTNAGKRAQQRKYQVHFRPADEELVSKAAAMANRFAGANLPEAGWSVVYPEIPLSGEEQRARREDTLELVARGLLHPAEAYRRLNPGTTRAQAEQALRDIAAARLTLNI